MRVAGIDPGQKGALAFGTLDLESGEFSDVTVHNMPLLEECMGRSVPHVGQLQEILRKEAPDFILVERVGTDDKFGARSAWTFALGFGMLVAACQMAQGTDLKRVALVLPTTWKKFYDIPKPKKFSTLKAREFFPGVKFTRADQAEALLIMSYFRDVLAKQPEVDVL